MLRSALFAAAALALPQSAGAAVPAGYDLVWADEFNTDGLVDPAKWSYDTEANRTGWYNNEKQYYAVERPENARVEDGRLIITARTERLTDKADYGGQDYSSARIITRGKASWQYGFYEIRAKLPCGKGSWPAIWMLGTTGGHPDGGEIDIMEHVGMDPEWIYGTIHNRATVGTHGDGGKTPAGKACSDFRRYQLTWTPEALEIGVDDQVFHRYERKGKAAAGWPFNKPQYLLLNLAVGGEMAGAVDDKIFPIQFEVDYVRVYQKKP